MYFTIEVKSSHEKYSDLLTLRFTGDSQRFFFLSSSATSPKTNLFGMDLESSYCMTKLKYFLQVRGKNNKSCGSEFGEYLQMD